jgi:hypothetical protein
MPSSSCSRLSGIGIRPSVMPYSRCAVFRVGSLVPCRAGSGHSGLGAIVCFRFRGLRIHRAGIPTRRLLLSGLWHIRGPSASAGCGTVASGAGAYGAGLRVKGAASLHCGFRALGSRSWAHSRGRSIFSAITVWGCWCIRGRLYWRLVPAFWGILVLVVLVPGLWGSFGRFGRGLHHSSR